MRNKKAAVGSKNRAKVHAVQDVLIQEHIEVVSVAALSQVAAQPFSDDETKEGAVNRARGALDATEADFGFGLEGGVSEWQGTLYLCNWGELATRSGQLYTAAGLRLPLPTDIAALLYDGLELSKALKQAVPHVDVSQGAVGYLTNGLLTRKTMFSEVVRACYGQYRLATDKLH